MAPLSIENKLKESRFIENIMVIGAGEKFVGALIVPAYSNLKTWCTENNLDFSDRQKLIKNPKVIELYSNEIRRYDHYFNHVEQVKKFELLPSEWTTESGELTPKLSLRRKIIMEKNKDAISDIYSS